MRNKNHILFIPSWYPNRNNPTHGIFNAVFVTAAALHNKVSVLHVCSEDDLQQDVEVVESIENNITTCIIYYRKVKNKLPGISQIIKRKKVLRAFEMGYQKIVVTAGTPDLIQLNVAMPSGIGVMYLSEKYNLPYVVNEGWSGYYPEDGNYKGILLKHFTRKILSKAKVIMPVSEGLKQAMLKHNLKGNYVVVPNAVNEELFKPIAVPLNNVTRFLHISSLNDTEKNVTGIIRAFDEACKKESMLELTIVGDGEDIEELKNLATELKLTKKINFKGRILGENLVKEINSNDALVMFSNYETFGITIIEALACGKPVITARSGGVAHLITPDLGLVVNRKDEKALANSFLTFAKEQKTYQPQLLRKFVTDRFTVTHVSEQLTKIYNTILSKTS